jgi:glycosyltransferase involved in cell wall biosynthesis
MVERADLLVLSSRHEAGPVLVAAAAAVGVPTLGTAVGQLVDWAPDAAVTVPVGDPMALASAINRLLDDDEERMRIARAAQARAIAESADWTAERILHHYAQLTGRLGAP